MTGFPINPPQAPLGSVSGDKLIVSPEWYKFFLAIQRKIGGPSDPFDDSAFLSALPEQSNETIISTALSVAHLVPPAQPPQEPAEGLVAPRAAPEVPEDRLEPYGAQKEAALFHNTLGEALTRANDTNVTLTLGGTPATALLKATSLTLGWTGTLAVARGGTGAGTLTGLLVGNGTSAFTAIAPGTGVTTALAANVGSAGAFVTFNGALGTPSSGTLTNCTFPTLNQNTTGSAATLTTTRTIFGQNFNGSANVTGALTATTGDFSGQITHTDTSADSSLKLLLKGTAKGLRMGTDAGQARIEGVDNTGGGSYEPLFINGSSVVFGNNNNGIATVSATGFDVVGEVRGDSLRIDQTPTAETPTPTHTFTINLNGTTYRIPCVV